MKEFVEKAISFRDTCTEVCWSSSIVDYTVIIDNDTIKINRYCDWNEYAYDNIQKRIFHAFFETVELKRKEVKMLVSERLKANWLPGFDNERLNLGDTLVFSEVNSIHDSYCWNIRDGGIYKSNRSGIVELKNCDFYNWNEIENSILLTLQSSEPAKTDNGEAVSSNGNRATFNLLSITETEFALKYLYHN